MFLFLLVKVVMTNTSLISGLPGKKAVMCKSQHRFTAMNITAACTSKIAPFLFLEMA